MRPELQMICRILITWVLLPLRSMKYIWWDAGGNHSLEFKVLLKKIIRLIKHLLQPDPCPLLEIAQWVLLHGASGPRRMAAVFPAPRWHSCCRWCTLWSCPLQQESAVAFAGERKDSPEFPTWAQFYHGTKQILGHQPPQQYRTTLLG